MMQKAGEYLNGCKSKTLLFAMCLETARKTVLPWRPGLWCASDVSQVTPTGGSPDTHVTCVFWGNTHTCPSVWEGYHCHRYIWVLGAQNWGVIWKKFYILIKINHWYSLKWQLIVERCSREACNPTRGWGRKITDLRPAKDKEKIEPGVILFVLVHF